MKKSVRYGTLLLVTITGACGSVLAQSSGHHTIQLMYPENNAVYRPVVEFRARKDEHAFIALGRELNNGLTYYYAAAGFFPGHGLWKNVLYGPGSVGFVPTDRSFDKTFKVYVTPEQEAHVKFILKNWDTDKSYSFPLQTCVDLVKDVARSLGLNTPAGLQQPSTMLTYLSLHNDATTPVKFAATDKAARAAEKAPILSNVAQRFDAMQREARRLQEAGVPTGGIGPGPIEFPNESADPFDAQIYMGADRPK